MYLRIYLLYRDLLCDAPEKPRRNMITSWIWGENISAEADTFSVSVAELQARFTLSRVESRGKVHR
jgi:hypothetical protein